MKRVRKSLGQSILRYCWAALLLGFTQVSIGQNEALVVLAHPDIERSQVNKHLAHKLSTIEHVTVHSLYEQYTDQPLDISREQALIQAHDMVVLQFPLYWFSSPSLLKQWQDEVFTSAFSIGESNRVKGKQFMVIVSVGGTEKDYQPMGIMKATMEDILIPYKTFARLTEMKYLEPFITYGVPNPSILNIPMTEDETALRMKFIESKGEELVRRFEDLLKSND